MSAETNGNTYVPGPTGPAITSSERVPGSSITTSTATTSSNVSPSKPIVLKINK